MTTENQMICLLFQKRNTKGMEILFNTYYHPLVLWADTFLNDIPRSEDLVQEFFVKLWEKNISSQLKPQTLKSYLFTCVKNQSLNVLAKHDVLAKYTELTCINLALPEYDDLEESLLCRIEAEIEKLAPRSRDVLTCIYLKEMRYKEVAELYGISIFTVKSLLVKALKKIRENTTDVTSILFIFFMEKISQRLNRF